MSTLTSSSTDAEVWAAYDDNASYEEDASRTKCLAFITACRILIRRRAVRLNRADQGKDFDAEGLHAEMSRARSWLQLHPASDTASVRYGDLENFREHAY